MKRLKWVDQLALRPVSYSGYDCYAMMEAGDLWFCVACAKDDKLFCGEATVSGHVSSFVSVYCHTEGGAKQAIVKRTRKFLQEALEGLT